MLILKSFSFAGTEQGYQFRKQLSDQSSFKANASVFVGKENIALFGNTILNVNTLIIKILKAKFRASTFLKLYSRPTTGNSFSVEAVIISSDIFWKDCLVDLLNRKDKKAFQSLFSWFVITILSES